MVEAVMMVATRMATAAAIVAVDAAAMAVEVVLEGVIKIHAFLFFLKMISYFHFLEIIEVTIKKIEN